MLAGCEHAENYRWASGRDPVVIGEAAAPSGSTFGDWRTPAVAVYSYATPAPAVTAAPTSTKFSIKDLSDHGQAALVEAMSKAGADAKTIMSTIATSGGAENADGGGASPTFEGSYSRTIVATVTKGLDAGPGDRLVWTWIQIRPLNFNFTGYAVVATDNETLQIEQVQNQSSASLQGQAGKTTSDTSANTLTSPGLTHALTDVLGTSLGATASLSSQYTTSATINQQYVKLSADIVPDELRIYHESERNLDVAGNTLIALTLKLPPEVYHSPTVPIYVQRVSQLKLSNAATNAPLAPADVTLQANLDEAPPNCALLADVTLLYTLRHITKNARSYVEGEQTVEFKRGSVVTKAVTMVPASEVRAPSWSIYGTQDPHRTNPITLVGNGEEILPLDFANYGQATAFALWLNQNANWFRTDPQRKIGRLGLALSSRVDGSLPVGPYFADRYHDQAIRLAGGADAQRADADQECKGLHKD